MKNIYFVFVLFVLLFAGCSSTYKVTNFSTKAKFYEEFNNSFKEREAKVTLVNDSTFIAPDEVEIKNETLYSYIFIVKNQPMQFSLADVADIEFTSDHIASAMILLKNGEKLNGNEVKVTKDSINFVGVKSLRTSYTIAQIDKVKTVTFKNKWNGIKLWAITGTLTGGIIGLLNVKSFSTSHWESQELMYFPVGASVGFILGAIAGYIVGYEVHYQFSP